MAEGAFKGTAPLLPGSQDRGTPIFKRSSQAVPISMPIGSQSSGGRVISANRSGSTGQKNCSGMRTFIRRYPYPIPTLSLPYQLLAPYCLELLHPAEWLRGLPLEDHPTFGLVPENSCSFLPFGPFSHE